MASVHDKIRAALETHLAGVTDIPDIAWENVKYSPTTGQPFVRPQLLPTLRQPAVRGRNPQMRYQGVFMVVCYASEGNGPSEADALADKIISSFEATTDLSSDSVFVSIDYAERQQGILDSPWYYVPVEIGWYSYN